MTTYDYLLEVTRALRVAALPQTPESRIVILRQMIALLRGAVNAEKQKLRGGG